MKSLKRKILRKKSIGCSRYLCLLCHHSGDNNTKKENQFNMWKCNLNFIRFELFSLLFFSSCSSFYTRTYRYGVCLCVILCLPISFWHAHTFAHFRFYYCVADTICHCYPLRIFFNTIQFILHFKLKIVCEWKRTLGQCGSFFLLCVHCFRSDACKSEWINTHENPTSALKHIKMRCDFIRSIFSWKIETNDEK